jgi:hypothetical protein
VLFSSLALCSSVMARLLRRLAESPLSSPSSLLKTLNLNQTLNASNLFPQVSFRSHSFFSASTPAAFDENLLRILRSEIAYYSDHSPPFKVKFCDVLYLCSVLFSNVLLFYFFVLVFLMLLFFKL